MCQTLTGQVVWQVVRRDGDQVDGKWKWSTCDFMGPLGGSGPNSAGSVWPVDFLYSHKHSVLTMQSGSGSKK
jgi:hypothetical protein